MIGTGLHSLWAQDLPACLPGRACLQEPPVSANLINSTLLLSPASAAIAAVYWAAIGMAVVLLANGLRPQRQTHTRPSTVLLSIAHLISGAYTVWVLGGWFAEVAAVYGGADGRPASPVPAGLISSWPLVQAAGYAAMILSAVALALIIAFAAVRRRTVRISAASPS